MGQFMLNSLKPEAVGNGLTSGNLERLAKAKHSWDI